MTTTKHRPTTVSSAPADQPRQRPEPADLVVPTIIARTRRTPLSGTVAACLSALAGFLVTLTIGQVASAAFDGGESFAGIALAAMTATVFAPLGALVGALVISIRRRRIRLRADEQHVLDWAVILAGALTLAVYGIVDAVAGLTTLILETAALLIIRIALADGVLRRSARPRNRRPNRRLPVRP